MPEYCACSAIAANGSAISCATSFATTRRAEPVARARRCALGRGALPTTHPRPGIAQADRAVEHETARRRVRIAAEIALPLELDGVVGICRGKRGLEPAVRQHFE